MEKTSACAHCGTPIAAGTRAPAGYCCHGCAAVAGLLRERGWGRFYDLKRGPIAPPSAAAHPELDWAWLADEVRAVELVRPDAPELELSLEGVSCLGCVWLAEQLFRERPGAGRLDLHPATGRLRLTWRAGAFDAAAWAAELRRFGYTVAPRKTGARGGSASAVAGRLPLAGFLALNTMLFAFPAYLGMGTEFELAGLFKLLSFLLATLSLVAGGGYFIVRAWRGARAGVLSMDLPIALGLVLAWLGSIGGWALGQDHLTYFDFVAIFTFLMLLGRWLQEQAVDRHRQALQRWEPEAQPVRRADGVEVASGRLQAGDRFELRPGQVLPVRAAGAAAASWALDAVTGEPAPQAFAAGQTVPAGAVLASGRPVLLAAEEGWAESLLKQLAEAQAVPWRDRAAERVLGAYIVAVLAVALLGGAAWALAGQPLAGAQAALSVLVVSCPCALGVALPVLHEFAVARLRRHGLFVRNPELWAKLRQVRAVAFDKTGTLTLEQPVLADPGALAALPDAARAALRVLTAGNRHPYARALAQELSAGPAPDGWADPDETPGAGVAAVAPDGVRWSLGKPGWAAPAPVGDADAALVLARADQAVAAFAFREALRPGAAETTARLFAMGLDVHLLSGDDPKRVHAIGAELGLDPARCRGGLSPQAKEAALAELPPERALMLGDGANDALAFARALCRGTPVSGRSLLEARADFYLLGPSLRGVGELFAVAAARARVQRWEFAFALTYNLAAVALALSGSMSPLLAALLMPASSLITLAIAASLRPTGPR